MTSPLSFSASAFVAALMFGFSPLNAVELVLTGPTHLGPRSFSVNAVVRTGDAPGRYWVEYGRGDDLSARTAPRPLPPVHGAHLEESWEQGTAGWYGGLSSKDLVPQRAEHGLSFVRYLGPTEPENRAFPGEPPGLDVNHVDGIGAIHLCQYIYSARFGNNPLWPTKHQGLNLGGGRPDFRDAQISLRLRGNAVDPRGAELTFWAQSNHDPALENAPSWVRANWAYTGRYLTAALRSGEWTEVSYVLENDTRRWSYGGNNLAQTRAERYAYANLDQTLGDLNGNFFHLYVFVDGKRPPTGTIDFDSVAITYRNHSLLFPAHGARLVAAPAGSAQPADHLTDGWRHGAGREWRSAASPREAQVFVWRFPQAVDLRTLQVHQAERFPAREVAASVSADGQVWRPLGHFVLPRESEVSPNHAYYLENFAVEGVTHFKLEVLSGYEEAAWSLGEVELFGRGLPFSTGREETALNLDLESLAAGERYSYRFVVETAAGEVRSAVGTLQVPAVARPVPLLLRKAALGSGGEGQLWGRVAPQGLRTHARVEVLRAGRWERASEDRYVGNQETERDVPIPLLSPFAEADRMVRLVLVYGEDRQVVGEPQSLETLTPASP